MNALETKVLEIIGENPDSPDVFVDTSDGMAQIRDSLNDAIQEIVSLTGSKVARYYLPLRQEQAFYRFSLNDGYLGWVTDAWSVNNRIRLEQTDLIRLQAHDPLWMVTNADPRAYFQIGLDVIGFYPKPGGTSNIIELVIVEIPKAYELGTDRVNLRDDFQYAAINYAVAEYWASRGDANQATTYFGYYLSGLGLSDQFQTQMDWRPRFTTAKEPFPKTTG